MRNPRIPLPILAAALLLLPFSFSRAQGPLTPPGAPAATMKTLAQIEPRTDLQATPAPLGVDTTNASYDFIINKPGSYYLSANLGVTKLHGIQINAEGVTLDLNGFEISRAAGTGGLGIEIAANGHRAAVRNGSLKGFEVGIRSVSSTSYPKGCAFRDLAVSGCTSYGILAGAGAVLEACRAHDNNGNAGIYADNGSTLSHCTATSNTAIYGIVADTGSTLSHCTASSNTGNYGIFVSGGCTLSHCTAYSNGGGSSTGGIATSTGCVISHCTAYNNFSTAAVSTSTTGMGFDVGGNNLIESCTAYLNEGDGINLFGDTLARANTCAANGSSGDGAGIHATSSDNRIEDNNVTSNDRGIVVDSPGNIILKNSASGNTTSNYVIIANNVFGAIVDRTAVVSAAVNGNSAVSSAGTTDPWANFAY